MRHALISVVVVAAMMSAGACTPAQQADRPTTPAPTPTTVAGDVTQTPTDAATPTPTEDEADRVAVVLDADGRVVVVDAASGEEVRELLDGVAVDDPASNDMAIGPDQADVFVAVPPDEPPGDPEIVRLSVDGSEQESVAEGSVPAVSPDGTALAYVSYEEPDGPGHHEPVLVLRDLATGDESRLSRQEPFTFIPDVEWAAGGSQIVFTAGEIHTGLYAVDRDAETLDDARRLGPDLNDEPRTTSWGPVAALGDGRLAVVERCCDLPHEERWQLAEVDVSDGSVEGSVLPDERVEATHLDTEATSGDLLIVVRGGPDGGELLRWEGQGEPEQITDGVIVAAW